MILHMLRPVIKVRRRSMWQLLFTVIWNLYFILVNGVFWSMVILIIATIVFAIIAHRTFVFPDVTTLPVDVPPVASLKCLAVPKQRWGKSYSFQNEDASESSSDTDRGDPHDLIVRCLQSHQEEPSSETGETSIVRSPRQIRRFKWRSRNGLEGNPHQRDEAKVCNGSLRSDRPRLKRQRTVESQSNIHVPSPIQSDEQEYDSLSATHYEMENDKELMPLLADRPLPSDYSISFADPEGCHDSAYSPGTLINHAAHPACTISGSVEISFYHDALDKTLFVTVVQAINLDSVAHAGLQIKLCLLPSKKQRFKTKVRHGKEPKFHECFHLKGLPPEDINSMGLRIRLYMYEKLVRGQLIGECVMGFGSINLDMDTTLWLTLEPRKALLFETSSTGSEMRSLSRSDSTLSAQSMPINSCSPELLIGLSFNLITGHLKVEVIKGSRFRSPTLNRPVDTFVKLSLLSSNAQEMSRAKTSVRRAQPNPIFRESFLFPVALFQLSDVTLLCSVYARKSMKRKQIIGWLAMGYNNTSRDGAAHWSDFQTAQSQVARWHALTTT